MYILYDKLSALRSTYLDKNFRRLIPFIATATFSFICLEKFDLLSKYTPRCLVNGLLAIGIPLNVRSGCSFFLLLQEKITSIACLVMSGLNTIFHWCARTT